MKKPIDFRANVIFSDESKQNFFSCNGKQKIRPKPNEELQPKNLIPIVKLAVVRPWFGAVWRRMKLENCNLWKAL